MSDLDSVNCEYMAESWGNLINTAIRTSTDKLVNCQCSREYVGFDVDVSNSMEKLRQQICDQKLDGRAANICPSRSCPRSLENISDNFLTTFEARRETA
jgi:hypothetical protein